MRWWTILLLGVMVLSILGGMHDSPDPYRSEGPRVVVDDGPPFKETSGKAVPTREPYQPCPERALCGG